MQYYIGFDIGGTKCALSLGKTNGDTLEILFRHEVPTTSSPTETLSAFDELIEEWKGKYGVTKAGVSCGSPLDAEKGVIVSPPNLNKNWHGFNIVKFIKDRYSLIAKLENDANACAVAEWLFGAGRNTKNMIFLTFGTGFGAGLILNGELYSGTNGNAGEIGHIRLTPTGPVGYNKEGSAEGYCSGGGIKNLALLRAKERGVTLKRDITTKEIFEKAKDGDEFFLSVIKESATKFGEVISLLVDLLNPEVIVTGGIFMRNHEFFTTILQPIAQRETLPHSLAVCKILPAEIGENIGDYAAIALARTIKE